MPMKLRIITLRVIWLCKNLLHTQTMHQHLLITFVKIILIVYPILISATMLFKSHYEAIMEGVELAHLDTTQSNASFGLHFYNRTTKALHGHIQFFTDLKNDGYVFIREHVLRNNEYKLTAIQTQWTIREVLQLDLLGLQGLFHKAFVPPLIWPLKKGATYTLNNWLHDDAKIQFPYAPEGHWKMIISIYFSKNTTKALDLHFYDHVVEVSDL